MRVDFRSERWVLLRVREEREIRRTNEGVCFAVQVACEKSKLMCIYNYETKIRDKSGLILFWLAFRGLGCSVCDAQHVGYRALKSTNIESHLRSFCLMRNFSDNNITLVKCKGKADTSI